MADAISGTPPDFPLFHGSIAEFVLSDPFEEHTKWIKEGYVGTSFSNESHYLRLLLSPL